MFRGIGVTVLRKHGLREGGVALWSSLIFGAAHLTNVFSSGLSALPQALIVSFAGYFFYLVRRVSRGNVLNSVMHGLFDFSTIWNRDRRQSDPLPRHVRADPRLPRPGDRPAGQATQDRADHHPLQGSLTSPEKVLATRPDVSLAKYRMKSSCDPPATAERGIPRGQTQKVRKWTSPVIRHRQDALLGADRRTSLNVRLSARAPSAAKSGCGEGALSR